MKGCLGCLLFVILLPILGIGFFFCWPLLIPAALILSLYFLFSTLASMMRRHNQWLQNQENGFLCTNCGRPHTGLLDVCPHCGTVFNQVPLPNNPPASRSLLVLLAGLSLQERLVLLMIAAVLLALLGYCIDLSMQPDVHGLIDAPTV